MHRRRGLPALIILAAAAAATPARTQTLTPLTEPPNGDTKSGVSIPDLSGIWGRWFTFEPPSLGPSPVVSKLHRPDGTMILSVVGDYTNPILRPEAAATIKRIGEMELSGTVLPNPHNQCWPEPTPFTLSIQLGVQLIQQKDEVVLLYLSDHQVRHVRLNVPHSAHPAPTWQGESVGHYEGDTLVVDTIGQKVGPLSMVDRYGKHFSAALHVIERYRLIDGTMAHDQKRYAQRTRGGIRLIMGEPGASGLEARLLKVGMETRRQKLAARTVRSSCQIETASARPLSSALSPIPNQ